MRHYTEKYILNPNHRLTVNLIGLGGTGSMVLTALGRMNHALINLGHPGFKVCAYDPDNVSPSNIGRQLFSPSDNGLNKANVLITRTNTFFGTDWLAIPKRFDTSSCPANITISCVDSVKSRKEIIKGLNYIHEKMSYENYMIQYYWMDFGNARDTGQVILGTLRDIQQPKNNEEGRRLYTFDQLYDMNKLKEDRDTPSCSTAEALRKQDLFINSTLAQLGCALLWKLFSGFIEYQGFYLNLKTMAMNPIQVPTIKLD